MIKDNIYCIGVFENFNYQVFPTHVSPIIVEYRDGLFRRWNYMIEIPYNLCLTNPVGLFKEDINHLFPYPSYHIFPLAVKITNRTQIIALDAHSFVIKDSKFSIITGVILHLIKNKNKLTYECAKRTMICIKNVLC